MTMCARSGGPRAALALTMLILLCGSQAALAQSSVWSRARSRGSSASAYTTPERAKKDSSLSKKLGLSWPFKRDERSKGTLSEIAAAPRSYVGHEVRFDCRFAMRGNIFNNFNTRFSERDYINFAVWDAEAELWDADARRQVVPTLYVPVNDEELRRVIKARQRYDLLTVTAVVENSYADLPWLRVLGIEVSDRPEDELSAPVLKRIHNAFTLQEQAKDDLAIEQLDLALQAGVPAVYQPTVQSRLAQSYVALENYGAADDAYGRAIAMAGDQPEYYLERAKVKLEMQLPSAALELCRQALALSAEMPEAHAVMGEAYGRLGQVARGLQECSVAANLPGATPEQKAVAEVHRARIYATAGRHREAVGAYARAIGEESPLAAKAWLRKEIGRFYEQRYEETSDIALLEEAIREFHNANVITLNKDAEGLYLEARARFQMVQATGGTDYSEVQALLQQAEQAEAGYVPARLLHGQIQLAQGQPGAAAQIFQEVAERHPENVKAQLSLAQIYERMGDLDQAAAAYGRVTELAPSRLDAWRKLAELSESLGRLREARDAYAALARLAPEEPLYAYHLGRLSLALDDYQAAAEASARAVGPEELGQQARLNQATALYAGGDIRGAEAALRALAEVRPDWPEAQAFRAVVLADLQQDLPAAVQLARAAVEAAPEKPAFLDALGWAQLRAGRPGDAIETLSAIPAAERPRAAWFHLGLAYREAGEFDKAVDALQKVTAPLREGELRGIAERLQQKAREILPEATEDEREARRMRERRRHLEALRRAREEAAELSEKAADPAAEETAEEPAEAPAAGEEQQAGPVAPDVAIEAVEPVYEQARPETVNEGASAAALLSGEEPQELAGETPPVFQAEATEDVEAAISAAESLEAEVTIAPAAAAPAEPEAEPTRVETAEAPRPEMREEDLAAATRIDWEEYDGSDVLVVESEPLTRSIDKQQLAADREKALRTQEAWRVPGGSALEEDEELATVGAPERDAAAMAAPAEGTEWSPAESAPDLDVIGTEPVTEEAAEAEAPAEETPQNEVLDLPEWAY